MARTLARTLDMEFRRIQFTPDLMPSDITGMDIIEEDPATGHRKLEFLPGPDLHQLPPRRRDQPDPAQDPGRAPPGDAGARGLDRPADLPARSRRSSSSPPRTRSRWRGRTPCPRPSSTGSCSTSRSSTRRSTRRSPIVKGTTGTHTAEAQPGPQGRGADPAPGPGPRRPGGRLGDALRRPAGRGVAAGRVEGDRGGPQVPALRGQPAGLAVPGPRAPRPGRSWRASTTSISTT